MSQIQSKNTKPEIILRKLLWAAGYKGYRLKSKVMGKPDIFFPKTKTAIFVDGCFWHGCKKCYVKPKTNEGFWLTKLKMNSDRDKKVNFSLKKQGIKVIRVWEHDIEKNPDNFLKRMKKNVSS